MMEDKSWRMLLCAVEVVGFWCFQSLLLSNIRRLIIVFLCLKVNKGLAYSTLLSIIQDVDDQTIYRQTQKRLRNFGNDLVLFSESLVVKNVILLCRALEKSH